MIKRIIVSLPFIALSLMLEAQDPAQNPYVSSPSITPSPLPSGGTGVFSFTAGNSGTDSLSSLSGPVMTLQVELFRGVPATDDPLQSLGGTFRDYFTWTFKDKHFTGTHSVKIPPKTSGTITIDYRVTSDSRQQDPQNGFRATIKAGLYTSNLTADDEISIYTWTECVIPAAPSPGTIMQPACTSPTGSVTLNGLPDTGQWTLTMNPGNVTTRGTGTTILITDLAPGSYTFTVTNSEGCTSEASQAVVINAPPDVPSAPVPGTITQPSCDAATGSVVLTGLPSSGSWTLTRNPGGTNINGTGTSYTDSGLTPGTYTYSVTNQAGCTSPSTNVVINSAPVTPSAPTIESITQPSCSSATGRVVLSGLPGTGEWTITRSPGGVTITGRGTSTTISGLQPGSYTFVVTNAAGCTSGPSGEVVINQPPDSPSAPVPGTITQPTCDVPTGSVILTGLPSSGSWTLTRNPGGTNINGTGTSYTESTLTAGTYTYTVTNQAGCTSPSSTNVVINSAPVTPSAPTTGSITQPSCSSTTGRVVLSGLPGTGEWTITRSPGGVTITGRGTSTTISGLQPATYTFVVTNSAGCTSGPSGEVVINQPPDSPSAPVPGTITQPTCDVATGSVVLTGLPSGNWTLTRNPGGTRIDGTGTSYTNSGLVTGSYTYTVTNQAGCTSSQSSAVTINPSPGLSTEPVARIDCSLGAGSAVITVTAPTGSGIQYRIDNGSFQSSAVFSGISNGSHVIVARNAAGCSVTGNPITVSCGCVNGPSVTLSSRSASTCGTIPFTLSSNTIGGNANSVTITENGAGTVSPAQASSSPFSFTYTPATQDIGNTVTITITTNNPVGEPCNAAAATFALAVNAVPTSPVPGTVTQPTCTSSTGSVAFSGLPAQGTWVITRNPGSVSTSGSGAMATITGLESGSYTFTVTNSAGCVSAASAQVEINQQPPIPAAPSPGSIVQPNCSTATGSVVLNGLPAGAWTLTRLPGRINSTGTGSSLTVQGLTPGTYNFTITSFTGCISAPSVNVEINSQPPTPAAPVPGNITAPTCATPTGTVILSGLPSQGQWILNSNPSGIMVTTTGSATTVSGLMPGLYTFTVTNSATCVSAASLAVIIPPVPNAPVLVINNPAAVCSPATVDITAPAVTAGSPAGLTYSYWTDQNTTIPFTATKAATNGTYYIKGTNSALCSDIKSVTVTVKEKPVANAGPDQDLEFQFTTTIAANMPQEGETGSWMLLEGFGRVTDPAQPVTQVTNLEIGESVFAWTVSNMVCPASSDTMKIQVRDLVIPTLITPNNDGRNEYLILRGTEALNDNELIVFDRRGAEVFRDKDYRNDWNGVDQDGSPLPDDTYFFVFRTRGGQKTGFIVIRR